MRDTLEWTSAQSVLCSYYLLNNRRRKKSCKEDMLLVRHTLLPVQMHTKHAAKEFRHDASSIMVPCWVKLKEKHHTFSILNTFDFGVWHDFMNSYRKHSCNHVVPLYFACSSKSSCFVPQISRHFNLVWRQIYIQHPSVIPFQSIGSFYKEISNSF